jgi:cytochrome P450
LEQRAIFHDPERYSEPGAFKPERFLKNGEVDKSILDPLDIAFGFGRRICPGRQIAMEMLKLTTASVLSFFNLSKAMDETGREIEPTRDYHESIIR